MSPASSKSSVKKSHVTPRRPLANTLHALKKIKHPSIEEAWIEALPTADDQTAAELARQLLKSQTPAAKAVLVQAYTRLPTDLQQHILDHIDRFYKTLRQALSSPDAHMAWQAAVIIRQANRPQLADLLAQRLTRQNDPALPKVAQGLLELAKQHPDHPIVFEALDAAARAYPIHQHKGLLLDALNRLPAHLPKLTRDMALAGSQVVLAIRKLAATPDSQTVAEKLLAIGRLPNTRQATAQGLEHLIAKRGVLYACSHAHLLSLKDSQAPLHRLKNPEAFWPTSTTTTASATTPVAPTTTTATRLLPCLLRSSAFPAETAPGRLGELAQSPDEITRLSAVRMLCQISLKQQAVAKANPKQASPQANASVSQNSPAIQSLLKFAHDPSPHIAPIVWRHLAQYPNGQYQTKLTGILGQVIASQAAQQSPALRQAAAAFLAPLSFDTLWSSWGKLNAEAKTKAIGAQIKIDPQIPQRISQRLAQPNRSTRLRALALVQACGLTHLFTQALVQLTQDEDRHVAASAVVALGAQLHAAPAQLDQTDATHSENNATDNTAGNTFAQAQEDLSQPTTLTHINATDHALRLATRHQDARVRANAIEAHPDLKHHQTAAITRFCHDQAPRPRANAIAAMADCGQGPWLPALRHMLDDPRRQHRVSALWVVESRKILETADTVAEIATSDQSKQVRQRASRAFKELLSIAKGPIQHQPHAQSGDHPSQPAQPPGHLNTTITATHPTPTQNAHS